MSSHVSVIFPFASKSSSTRITVVTVATGVNLHVSSNTISRCERFLTFVARENLVCRLCARKYLGINRIEASNRKKNLDINRTDASNKEFKNAIIC